MPNPFFNQNSSQVPQNSPFGNMSNMMSDTSNEAERGAIQDCINRLKA